MMMSRGAATMPISMVNSNSNKEEKKDYIHYNHTDSSQRYRWTARESFQYMHGRPWQNVVHFYADLVRSTSSSGYSLLSSLFPHHRRRLQEYEAHDIAENFHDCGELKLANKPTEGRTGRWERVTFKIVLSYHGASFDGWQKQPGLNTVQGLVEKVLGSFIDDRKASQLRDKCLPLEGCAVASGRTDKGVTALHQVCSFYTWKKDVKSGDIKDAINEAAPDMLSALFVSKVSRVFHPNFSAKYRRYFYIFPLDHDGEQGHISARERDCSMGKDEDNEQLNEQAEYDENSVYSAVCNGNEDFNVGGKPRSFSVSKVNQLLCQLEGKSLSYKIFARDTKASRSIGPPTECYMFHARAAGTNLPCANQESTGVRVMCVELVANRFLRKMVRVLVATAIREAAAGAEDDALIKLMDATCRRATAPPAPPDGLCLVNVGYGEFNRESCLIL